MTTKTFHIIHVRIPMLTCSKLLLETFSRFFYTQGNKLHFIVLYRQNGHEQSIYFCLCCIIMLR